MNQRLCILIDFIHIRQKRGLLFTFQLRKLESFPSSYVLQILIIDLFHCNYTPFLPNSYAKINVGILISIAEGSECRQKRTSRFINLSSFYNHLSFKTFNNRITHRDQCGIFEECTKSTRHSFNDGKESALCT